MYKFLLAIYLWFHGISLCKHNCSGLRYCMACENEAQEVRLAKYVVKQERLERLQKIWRGYGA